MLRHPWILKLANQLRPSPRKRSAKPRRAVKLHLESLEERVVPSTMTYNVTDAATLQTAISAINSPTNTDTGDTIILASGTYKLKQQVDISNPNNPNDIVTIEGDTSVDTILKAGSNQRAFYLVGGNVIFENLTIENGTASDDGSGNSNTTAEGGGILDKGGNVTLSNVVLQNNKAQGTAGQSAAGGGLYVSGGSLNIVDSVIQKNQADGGNGAALTTAQGGSPLSAGQGSGGGLYVYGGSVSVTASITNSTIMENTAAGGNGQSGVAWEDGGDGGSGGQGAGGGIYATASQEPLNLSVTGTTVSGNKALGGQGGQGAAASRDGAQDGGDGGPGGLGTAGGVFLDGPAVSALFTSSTLTGNVAKGGAGGLGGAGVDATTRSVASPFSGGRGGDGGGAGYGGLFSGSNQGVQINLSSLVDNTVTGGDGGDGGGDGGGIGGGGGDGGFALGGGGGAGGGEVSITSSTVAGNTVRGGNGGAGGLGARGRTGGFGGEAGDASGGGFFAADAALYLFASTVSSNSLTGGKGGDGGDGGDGGNGGLGGSVAGGGVYLTGVGPSLIFPSLGTRVNDALLNSTIADNTIKAGKGGMGGAASLGSPGHGGNGGDGGTAQGGGAYFDVPVQDGGNGQRGATFGVLFVNDTVAYNKAKHRAGGAGGAGVPPPIGGGPGLTGDSGSKTPSQGGGIFNAANEGVSLINTLVALNTANEDADYDGEVDNTDDNLIGDASGSTGFSTTNGDLLGTEPELGQLADNDGPLVGAPGNQTTLQTIALLPDSAGIAGGDVSATAFTGPYDERGIGFDREVNNTIDIGAFEVQPPRNS